MLFAAEKEHEAAPVYISDEDLLCEAEAFIATLDWGTLTCNTFMKLVNMLL
jgi:hypothetical protein